MLKNIEALAALDLYADARRTDAGNKYAVLSERREVKKTKKVNETREAGVSRKISRREMFAKKISLNTSDLPRICYVLK